MHCTPALGYFLGTIPWKPGIGHRRSAALARAMIDLGCLPDVRRRPHGESHDVDGLPSEASKRKSSSSLTSYDPTQLPRPTSVFPGRREI